MNNSQKKRQDEKDDESTSDDGMWSMPVDGLPNYEHCRKTNKACGDAENVKDRFSDTAHRRLSVGTGGEKRQHGAHHRKEGTHAREGKGGQGHRSDSRP